MSDVLLESFTQRRKRNNEGLSRTLLKNIWQIPAEDTTRREQLMSHYDAQSSLVFDKAYLSLKTHKDALELINHLKSFVHRPKLELTNNLTTISSSYLKVNSHKAAARALRFALTTWLFVDDRDWRETEAITTYLARLFPQNTGSLGTDPDDDSIDFDGHGLERIGGFKLKPTSRLQDHLRFERKAGRIYFFRHAVILERRDDPQANLAYPDGLLEETAKTLSLLFAWGQSSHKRWRQRIRKTADIDVEPGVACNPSPYLSDYKYWGKRLQAIQEAYDKVEPRTLSQWLHDWRKPNRTWTFWLAFLAILLTLIFGLIQSVTGIIQAVRQR